jgi:hypothetical protein
MPKHTEKPAGTGGKSSNPPKNSIQLKANTALQMEAENVEFK